MKWKLTMENNYTGEIKDAPKKFTFNTKGEADEIAIAMNTPTGKFDPLTWHYFVAPIQEESK